MDYTYIKSSYNNIKIPLEIYREESDKCFIRVVTENKSINNIEIEEYNNATCVATYV